MLTEKRAVLWKGALITALMLLLTVGTIAVAETAGEEKSVVEDQEAAQIGAQIDAANAEAELEALCARFFGAEGWNAGLYVLSQGVGKDVDWPFGSRALWYNLDKTHYAYHWAVSPDDPRVGAVAYMRTPQLQKASATLEDAKALGEAWHFYALVDDAGNVIRLEREPLYSRLGLYSFERNAAFVPAEEWIARSEETYGEYRERVRPRYEDTDASVALVQAWLRSVGWADAQVTGITPYEGSVKGDYPEPKHDVHLLFPGGETVTVTVATDSERITAVSWPEDASDTARPLIEAARSALQRFFGVTTDADAQFTARKSEWAYQMNGTRTTWTTVEYVPRDGSGLLYRVELNADGLRRLHRVHTGEAGFWQETGTPDMAACAKRWDFLWVLGAQESLGGMGDLLDRAGTGDAGVYEARMLQIRSKAEAFLEDAGVPHGEILPGASLFANNRYEKTDTDIFLVFDFDAAGDGAGGRVGYSLFQREIAFLDLNPEDDAG